MDLSAHRLQVYHGAVIRQSASQASSRRRCRMRWATVRATEVEKVTGHGQHRYIVAIDVDASSAGSQH